MRTCIGTLLLIVFFLSFHTVSGQDKAPFKFGKISTADFAATKLNFDSGAHAIVIGDIGYSAVVPNNEGWFGYEYTRKMRVKVIDKNGIEAGKFEIGLYNNSDSKEEMNSIKGTTYNLEGGKIVETDLEKKDIFTEKYSRNIQLKKFSLPALKEGSIFEVSYSIKSDFLFDFRKWAFQGELPVLWSEYEIEVPEYFDYVYLMQGYQPFHISTSKEVTRNFLIRGGQGDHLSGPAQSFTITGLAMQKRWVIKDVPALKEESFTTTVRNHISKIEFQLSAIRLPNSAPRMIMENWAKVYQNYMEREDFGLQLNRNTGAIKDVVEPVVAGATSQLVKAKKIFDYVRDSYTCSDHSGIVTSSGLKQMLKTRSGNVADMNLLLTAMLRTQNIEVYPVFLSTRDHGLTHQLYPLMDRFNYLICLAVIDGAEYLLDASYQDLGFGKLSPQCYNGHARVLTENPEPIFLAADSLLERKVTMAIIDSDDKKIFGRIQSNFGYFQSFHERGRIRSKGENSLLDELKVNYGSEYTLSNYKVDSLKKPEMPIKVEYDVEFSLGEEDVIYFNPVLEQFSKENPFKSAERRYPVEMPYKIDETYILNFDLPSGYVVDEIPKSTRVAFNENEGYFEYLINESGGKLQLRTRVVLNKANFDSVDYESLREFFSYVIKKQSEQVVLKKKSTK